MGRCALVTENESGWLCGTGCLILQFPSDLSYSFLVKFFGSPYTKQILKGDSVGITMDNLNQKILENLLIPLPPLAEQRRIVAKVNDLMALCDQLEGELEQTEQLGAATLAALVGRTTEGGGVGD